ncbi:MAG: DNA polymerase III subunit gamma/tau, partial [Clostridiaceae bacterium]|nr:DNA polymerase III subunit gamma/tau [Clostridiaceae bacterium]
MAYKALYREWRPRTFEDVVGQGHVTITLKNQIKGERIAHAYLLCGTRGTGKTSTAKILAKAVNCLNSDHGEPCNQCEMCKKINSGTAIDVTEIDAAS